MTNFGKWLGKENGKTMLVDIAKEDVTKEQFRAAVTTYCIIFDVAVDTKEWDELVRYIFSYYNSWFKKFDDFDGFMCELLV